MKTPITEGYLVVIEGIDGAGKTSVATAIAQWCGERGLLCCFSKEPTGEGFGEVLRQSAAKGRLTLDDELDLFNLDRKAHVERSIRPALDENAIVVIDRYYWSTAAYQGARGANPQAVVATNETFAPKPDLVILLDLPVSEGLQRIRARGDEPNDFEKTEGLEKAREIFLGLAKSESNCYVIDATKTMREVVKLALNQFKQVAVEKIVTSAKAKYGMVRPEQLNQVLALFGEPPIDGAAELVAA